jgi:hypothetical protein
MKELWGRLQAYHQRVWHVPVRAETYALMRIVVAFCLLTDQLVQYLPNLEFFYGAAGAVPAGVSDHYLLSDWRWTYYIFHPDDMRIIWTSFLLWMGATIAMLVGCKTRWATAAVWFGYLCFYFRNDFMMNSGDRLLCASLFILMLLPTGEALSIDRRGSERESPLRLPAWGVRVFQWQIAFLYLSTGICKAYGSMWWDGTVMHYVLNDVTMTHWSFGVFALPLWMTQIMTWVTLCWELLFLPLVWYRPTRKWVLMTGICFHLGIVLLIEVGWFGFYTLCYYAAFVPDSFWEDRDLRLDKTQPA